MNELSPRLVKWILYNLPMLRECYESMEPSSTTCYFPLAWASTNGGGSKIERAAIRRETLGKIIAVLDKTIRGFHPEHRKVYRMRYRAGLKYWQIQKRAFLSEKTVERRLTEIENQATLALLGLPDNSIDEIRRILEE